VGALRVYPHEHDANYPPQKGSRSCELWRSGRQELSKVCTLSSCADRKGEGPLALPTGAACWFVHHVVRGWVELDRKGVCRRGACPAGPRTGVREPRPPPLILPIIRKRGEAKKRSHLIFGWTIGSVRSTVTGSSCMSITRSQPPKVVACDGASRNARLIPTDLPALNSSPPCSSAEFVWARSRPRASPDRFWRGAGR
jgi:hypothetical protein